MNQYNTKLFDSFPPVTTTEWEAKIHEDLKGADYNKKLIWKTDDGFEVKPYYRAEDVENNPFLSILPGDYPFIRGTNFSASGWEIRQDIETEVLAEANRLAVDALSRGAMSVGLVAENIHSINDLAILLQDIDLATTPLHFTGAASFTELVQELAEYTSSKAVSHQLSGSFDFDPLSVLLLNGDFENSEKADLAQVPEMVKLGRQLVPAMKMINVNGHYLNSAGASLAQELGFALAAGNEYLAICVNAGMPVDDVASSMMFTLSTGSDYFSEIAKLRAARLLWAKIVEQYKPADAVSMKMWIHCNTSSWNKTLYDPYVNILRTSTEAMSAVLGGAQSLSIIPFDTFFKDPDEFSNRIARNQQVILKEEAYLDKVADPAAGSYYIENLTLQIAEAAWKIFLETESKAGMLAAIKQGFVQDTVSDSAAKKLNDVASRRITLLGTNQYPNTGEQMLGKIHFAEEDELLEEEMYADEEADIEDEEDEPTPFKKLEHFGGSDAFDQIRLAVEQSESETGRRPEVFLFTFGNLASSKARAMFTTNFFGCAGYKITDSPAFENIDNAVNTVKAAKPEIVVLCSSDDEYATTGIEALQKLRKLGKNTILVVAGYPKEILEDLKKAGADEYIHVRSNLLETLESFNVKLGIF